MLRKTRSYIIITALMVIAFIVSAAFAQDMGQVNRTAYYIAPDNAGVQQIYQLLLDGESEPRQITQSQSDVITFSAAYDGLAVAYISVGQLWLQSTHTEGAQALAPITDTQFYGAPVFSQDGQYVAYPNNGIWLLNLGTREIRELIADVPLASDGSNMADYRLYEPVQFVVGVDTNMGMSLAQQLIVRVSMWEWQTSGVVDLATGELLTLEGMQHTSILPLYGDRVLVFGNNGMSGDFALRFADSREAINNAELLVEFAEFTDKTLFASEAVEIHPGIVRVYGYAMGDDANIPTVFSFDYDVMARELVSDVRLLELPQGQIGGTNIGRLSPDGAVLPVYVNTLWTDMGSMSGEVSLYDVTSGEIIAAPLPEVVTEFRWQP